MSEKRRDNKGRLLKDGETQRADGKYEFKFFDSNGVRRSVYSWKLVPTDKLPAGKRQCEALRVQEKRILKDIEDGINTFKAKRVTFNDYFYDYISTKGKLKQSTITNYKYLHMKYIKDNPFGNLKVESIKYSDVKKFYIHLMNDIGFQLNSLSNVHDVIHPVLSLAVRDDVIRRNPSDGILGELKKETKWQKPKRHSLTVEQQERFVEYASSSPEFKSWMPIITLLLGTGLRISEAIGLRWDDCDFKENTISVNHNLVYRVQDDGHYEFHITTTKTDAGNRIIPMFNAVREAILNEYYRQLDEGFTTFVVDGYKGFIFGKGVDKPLPPVDVNRILHKITKAANEEEERIAKENKRLPFLLPQFSCHHLRHTFCTRLCENETNLKVIQEIMGHSDFHTTMDIYNEATHQHKVSSFTKIEGKIRLS